MNRETLDGEGDEKDLSRTRNDLEGVESVKCVDINGFYDSDYD